jgi:hypothetical protein
MLRVSTCGDVALSLLVLALLHSGRALEDINYRKRFNPIGTVEPPRYVEYSTNRNASVSAIGTSVSLSASVFVFSLNDVPVGSWGECIAEVDRAALFASRSIQIVVTTYYVDANRDTFVDSYCVTEFVGSNRQCKAWDAVIHTRFYAGVEACVRYAISRGFTQTITFNPRLDMLPDYSWRVSAQFNPLGAVGGVSYYDVMLKPFATLAKLVAAISPSTTVRLALGGEMHFTLTYAPAQYIQAIQQLRAEAASARFQIGAHFSPWELCPSACSGLTTSSRSAIIQLFNAFDFVGVSVYPQIPEKFGISALETELLEMQAIIRAQIGVDIATFATRGALHILEIGWGGGVSDNGDVPATIAAQVADNPWRGVFGAYKVATDPWKQYTADDVNIPTRTWLRQAYAAVLTWLKAGGGPNLRVGDAYVWTLASWDVLGIHWLSYDASGNTYRDNVISNQVALHNAAISGMSIPYRFPYRQGRVKRVTCKLVHAYASYQLWLFCHPWYDPYEARNVPGEKLRNHVC